ncbi:hypothetical protein AB1Y20_009962 [Prymnesium parvum]|uniref:Polyprenol reductase n=1 Tax=Prymnesium parvum TaxID=97485 RepID=A0AB34K826_PRYPA
MLPLLAAPWACGFNPFRVFMRPPPPPPPPPPPAFHIPVELALFLALFCCWAVPAFLLLSRAKTTVGSPLAKKAKTATGKEVPKDVIRRQEAYASQSTSVLDRVLQISVWGGLIIPMVWVFATQESPSASEQLTTWFNLSLAQLTNGKITANFQVAAFLLFIERATYTWVHSFSASFMKFVKSPLGRALGEKPLDVVLNLFFINKTIQMGTFIGWYFYIIDFESPFVHGYAWHTVTRLQWVLLAQALVIGQGLNMAIYRAIGKSGVYYGYRLGMDVPWVVGFPFNVGIPHPQYIGACLTCFGVNAWCATETHLQNGWLNLTMLQILYYVYMGMVEDFM